MSDESNQNPKIDSWMAFYGNDFFQAVKPYSDAIGFGYLRAIWYYWHDNHCAGIENDVESLQRICGIFNEREWEKAQHVIFGKWFHIERGLWHQTKAREIHKKALIIKKSRIEVARKGGLAKAGKSY